MSFPISIKLFFTNVFDVVSGWNLHKVSEIQLFIPITKSNNQQVLKASGVEGLTMILRTVSNILQKICLLLIPIRQLLLVLVMVDTWRTGYKECLLVESLKL